MSTSLLIIFIKNPVLGKVKTRLAKTIGDKKALAIYEFLLNHTMEITKNLSVDKIVYYADGVITNDIWDGAIYQKKQQKGGDLGERMYNAFADAFASGYKNVIIIGSDLLDIDQNKLEKAFLKLNDQDAVIGPAADGGYYLLGLKAPQSHLFKNKSWGTPTVLKDTLKDLKDYNVHLLETLNDIDTFEDMKGLSVFEPYLKN